ncbi:Ig-like domain-containing protein, partial [Stieleria sp.]|uniref:Ig-like domain-containing protein n=1 Tax=Stieleria sp. TaxID=2795976 RepID=UPI00356B5C9D
TDAVAVTDYFRGNASESLSVDASGGLLGNDASGITGVWRADAATRWGASVTVASDGSFTLVPADVYTGIGLGESITDSFTYTVRAADFSLHTATVWITIEGENQPPVAVHDEPSNAAVSLYTRAGGSSIIDPADLLRNDIDPDVNDSLAITSVEATSLLGAAVTLSGGDLSADQIVYDPRGVAALDSLAAGEHRIDRITYTISDPNGVTHSSTASVWVQSPINLAPSAAPGTARLTEDGVIDQATFDSLLAGAVDTDHLPSDPELAAVEEVVTSSLGAMVSIRPDGTFTYDSSGVLAIQSLSEGETTEDTFLFRVTDGLGLSAAQPITLTVVGTNDAPSAVDDVYIGVPADGLLTTNIGNGLLANDFDNDSPPPLIVDPSQTASHSVSGAAISLRPDGTFDYDPQGVFDHLAEGETAVDTFTYVVLDDQGAESTATVTVEIHGVDDAPIAGIDDIERGYWTVASQTIEVPADEGVLTNDHDPDSASSGTVLAASFDGLSQYGARVTVRPDGSFRYDPTASQTLRDLQAAGVDVIDSFTYTLTEVPSSSAAGPSETLSPAAPLESTSEGVVEIIVRSGPSAYSFDVVGKDYDRIGSGVSINNHGNVAYTATLSGRDTPFIWSDETGGAKPLIPNEFLFGDATVSSPPRGSGTDTPELRFSDNVQLTDFNRLLVQRQLNARTVSGVIQVGYP